MTTIPPGPLGYLKLKLIDGTSEGLKIIVVGWFKKLGFDETFPRSSSESQVSGTMAP